MAGGRTGVAYLDGTVPLWSRAGSARSLPAVTPEAVQAGTLPVFVSAVGTARSAESEGVGLGPGPDPGQHGQPPGSPGGGSERVVMTLARADGVTARADVSVRLDYGAFAEEYGGSWGTRLRLVALPGCALTTPAVARCRKQTPLAGENETSDQRLTATVPVTSGAMVVAATATDAGAEGTYSATSLKASGSWVVQDGDFSYSYPITVPPALGGTAPSVALTYDSQSIDGETSGSNTQASWIGDGWNYSPGFIERSYEPCSQDGITNSGDLCWCGYNAVLSFGGGSSAIVRDDATGTWHLQNDDGASVEELDDASNGVWNGEYWLVTMPDGTKYYFGLGHLPGGTGSDAATNSAWGEPVYNPHSGDPCTGCSGWPGLGVPDEVPVEPRLRGRPVGNLTVYDYATEKNYYQMGGGQDRHADPVRALWVPDADLVRMAAVTGDRREQACCTGGVRGIPALPDVLDVHQLRVLEPVVVDRLELAGRPLTTRTATRAPPAPCRRRRSGRRCG